MMNQADLFKKIGNILTELQDQYQYLAENPKDLNELELELFLSNANFLTDHIHIVIKANSHQEVKAIEAPVPDLPKANHKENSFKPDNEPDAFEFLMNDHSAEEEQEKQNKFEFEEKAVNEIFNRPLTPEEQQIIAQKQSLKSQEALNKTLQEEDKGPEPFLVKPQEELKQEEPLKIEVIKEEAVPVIAVDEIEAPVKLTLNERLAGNLHVSRTPEAAVAEVKDLKQAISLNDKLLFVKDLFHGYSLAYAEVIDLLNKMPDFDTADAFLQKNYAIKNDWNSKQVTVDRFYELLKKRFQVK